MSSDLLDRIRLDGRVPPHVAIIMDGNGRWASTRGLPRHAGHRSGIKAVRDTVEGAVEAGVEVLTLFAFSTENWQRPPREVAALMGLLRLYTERETRSLQSQGVEVHILGETERLDVSTRTAVQRIVDQTRGGTALRLNLMLSYGGREEIIRAARLLAEKVRQGRLDPDQIDHDSVQACLFTCGLQDPDLLIRTSGEFRVSNFMLWQLAYTELHISQVLWPDFTRNDLFEAILDYQRRERRFGRVEAG